MSKNIIVLFGSPIMHEKQELKIFPNTIIRPMICSTVALIDLVVKKSHLIFFAIKLKCRRSKICF